MVTNKPRDYKLNERFKEQKPNLKIIIYSEHGAYSGPPSWDYMWADWVIPISSDLTELIETIKRLIG